MKSRKLLPLAFVAALAFCVITSADEKVLYEKKSAYNTIIVTEDDHGLRTLWFEPDGARQSVVKPGDVDHIELPYARTMPAGLAFVERPRRVLIVGLGGGTIPGFLHKHYPQTIIDVVDIDPDVVQVAKEFFGFREDSTLHAYAKDGRRFIEECRAPYDIIFLDAFGSDNIPYRLATREFLQAVRRALTPNGVAVGNVWSRSSNSLYDAMVRTYQDVFDELYIIDAQGAGNKILIALPRRQRIQQEELVRRARRISQEEHFRFDMGELVVHGFEYASEKDPSARVLLDRNEPQKTE